MRLAVNASSLRSHGSRFVGLELVKALAKTADVSRVDAWVPSSWSRGELQGSEILNVYPVRPGAMGRAALELWKLDREVRRANADAFISLVNAAAPSVQMPQLVLIHQALLAYPESEWDFQVPPLMRGQLAILSKLIERSLDAQVIWSVQSQSMKRALMKRWGLQSSAVKVVPHAIAAAPPRSAAWSKNSPIRLFYAAHQGWYKNHAILASAIHELRRKGIRVTCQLTVRSEDVSDLVDRIERLGVEKQFEFLGPLTREKTLETLSSAFAAVIPSKLESFGFCYFEAMAAGTPVVAADKDFSREACGSAALYAPADSGRAFADQVERLVSEPGVREGLISSGHERLTANRRAWDDVAATYVRLLGEASIA